MNNHLKIFIGLIILSIIVWFIGGISFTISVYPFSGMFGEIKNLQNVFSPIATLFSAITSASTIYLLYIQINEIKNRKDEFFIQKFESKFFQLISIHIDNVKNMSYEFEKENNKYKFSGNDAFYIFYTMFHVSCYAMDKNIFREPSVSIQHSSSFESLYTESITGDKFSYDTILNISESILSQETHYKLHNYYHNVYVILKYIDTIADHIEKDTYLRFFRAQLSAYEYILIYYHALIYKDEDGVFKFKDLIESTKFFHNIKKELIIDNECLRYKKTAFH